MIETFDRFEWVVTSAALNIAREEFVKRGYNNTASAINAIIKKVDANIETLAEHAAD